MIQVYFTASDRVRYRVYDTALSSADLTPEMVHSQ
jgi:hypothetical protein